jgi:hypothetical protein
VIRAYSWLTGKPEVIRSEGPLSRNRACLSPLACVVALPDNETDTLGLPACRDQSGGKATAHLLRSLWEARKSPVYDPRRNDSEPEEAPTLTRALEAGRPVDAEAGGIAADSLAPRRVRELVFPIVQRYVARTVLVKDDAIQEAQRLLWIVMRIVAEPGGAAAFAALISGRYVPRPQERVGVLICGGNTIAVDFSR